MYMQVHSVKCTNCSLCALQELWFQGVKVQCAGRPVLLRFVCLSIIGDLPQITDITGQVSSRALGGYVYSAVWGIQLMCVRASASWVFLAQCSQPSTVH